MRAKARWLFEVSWEVVNKVGGINTVIKSKANIIDRFYEHYFLIGPFFKENYEIEVIPKPVPNFLAKAFNQLSHLGLKFYYGLWRIKGKPEVILIDYSEFFKQYKNEIKTKLWDWYKVDSLCSTPEFENPVVWSYTAGLLLEVLQEQIKEPMVAHFHEWLSGGGLLYLKQKNSKIATVFTTHATFLGRSIAGNNLPLYDMLGNIDLYAMAKQFGIIDKYTMERATTNAADIFTTVSEITEIEAEALLGRKPEVLVLNGIDVDKYPTFEECSVKHTKYREVIRDFLKAYFYPYYYFDLKHSLTFFTSSRYEFHNKGIDIFINALGRLNQKLKKENIKRNIIVFFWVPQPNQGVKKEILENKTRYRNILQFLDDYENEIQRNLVDAILSGKELKALNVFPENFLADIKLHYLKFKKSNQLPSLTTHMIDEKNDPIINAFKQANLLNREEDKVKVILYPVYLTGVDGLLDLRYSDAVIGTHLGVFPSYYEPWGYTPVETIALGVPAITTDLAGFGRFMQDKIVGNNPGLWILPRFGKSDDEATEELTELLFNYAIKHRHERVLHKMNAKALTEFSDWDILIENYIKAHNLALTRVK